MDLLISIPITICLIILVHHLRAIHLRRQKNLPPGQYGLPLIGETLQLMSAFKSDNPQPFIEKRVARFGLIFTTHLFGEPTVFSVDPDFNLFVLQNEFKLFESSYPTSISKLVGKHSLLLMKDGNLHKRLHTLTITFAGNANIRDHLFGDIESKISSFLNFVDGKIFLLEETKKIAFALTVKLLMSIEPCEWSTSLEKEYLHLIGGFFALPLPFIYTTYNRAMKAREIVAEQLTSVVKQRRRENEQGNKKKDIIGALLHEESGRRGGKEFSDEEIADFLVAILVAGLETTSSSMAIAIKLLTDTPLALAQLKDEQDKIKAKRNGRALNWDDYKSMVFTQCVPEVHCQTEPKNKEDHLQSLLIDDKWTLLRLDDHITYSFLSGPKVINETLRYANLVGGIFRRTTSDINFKGHTIPKGWKLITSIRGVHMTDDHFKDPHTFNPWRWQNDTVEKDIPGMFAPFGGGPRLCPGYELARVSLSIFLHHFVTNYRWEPTEDDKFVFFPTTGTQKQYPIYVHKRHTGVQG